MATGDLEARRARRRASIRAAQESWSDLTPVTNVTNVYTGEKPSSTPPELKVAWKHREVLLRLAVGALALLGSFSAAAKLLRLF